MTVNIIRAYAFLAHDEDSEKSAFHRVLRVIVNIVLEIVIMNAV